MGEYKRHSGGTYNVNYHVVFCPKRRKAVLVGNISHDCEVILRNTAESVRCKIENCTIMPDHVHLFVSAPPTIAPHSLVKRLKGATSNYLRENYPQLKRLPTLWSSSYYVGTVGTASESVVKLYIEAQRGK